MKTKKVEIVKKNEKIEMNKYKYTWVYGRLDTKAKVEGLLKNGGQVYKEPRVKSFLIKVFDKDLNRNIELNELSAIGKKMVIKELKEMLEVVKWCV